ncbi:MAG: hypothetical protein QY326_00695 [Bdellovibrionota bacterium]|nr:MAG: hypothetical protein QY326_00695 [Bdellovibrionota bacterium]
MRVVVLSAVAVVACMAHGVSAQAEFAVTSTKVAPNQIVPLVEPRNDKERSGFFTGGEVSDVFGSQLAPTDKPELRYFNAKDAATAKSSSKAALRSNPIPQVPTSKEAILQQFGDPSQEMPVRAVDNAPLPFKGLIAAVEAGEDDLAFQYAKQYARYMEGVRRASARAVSLTGLAMEKEGYVEDGGWTGVPQFDEDRALLEKELSKDKQSAGAAKEPIGKVTTIDEKIKTLIERAKKETASEGNLLAEAEERKNEQLERKAVRLSRQGKIPADPSGKLDVYWFFSPDDPDSQSMAPAIEKLHKESNGELMVVGVTLKPMAPQTLKKFSAAYGVTFPLRTASNLAKGLGVAQVPTTAFIGQQSGKAYFEVGALKFHEVDEIAKMARGK